MSYLSEALADSPLVLLLEDETSGTTAIDSSGNGRDMTSANCTLNQPTVMPAGTASYDFNGTSSQISLADAAWQRPAAFTIEKWIRADSVSSFHAIAAKDGNLVGWAFYIISGQLSLYTNGTAHTEPTPSISTATDYYVAATYDTGAIKLYVNGAQVASFTGASLSQTSGTPLIFGASTGSNGGASRFFWFDGRGQAGGYYGTALSGARIAAHYAAGAPNPNATVNAVAATATAAAVAPGVSADSSVAATVASASATALPPAVSGTGDATVSAVAATATTSVLPPTLSAHVTLAAVAAQASASALAPVVSAGATIASVPATATASAHAPVADDGSGSQTVFAVPATATAVVLPPVWTQVYEVGTDTTNALDGFDLAFEATVTITRPVAALPPTLVLAPKVDKAAAYPVPTMVDGRPT